MIWPFYPVEAPCLLPRPDQTAVDATDLFLREPRCFTVLHQDETILAILDATGSRLSRFSAQFTEVSEAFYIDRRRRKSEPPP